MDGHDRRLGRHRSDAAQVTEVLGAAREVQQDGVVPDSGAGLANGSGSRRHQRPPPVRAVHLVPAGHVRARQVLRRNAADEDAGGRGRLVADARGAKPPARRAAAPRRGPPLWAGDSAKLDVHPARNSTVTLTSQRSRRTRRRPRWAILRTRRGQRFAESVKTVSRKYISSGIPGTPTVQVNGRTLRADEIGSPDALRRAIETAS